MKRICLLVLVLIFALSNVQGQIRFSKFYDYNRTANLIADVVVLDDTGYFTVSQCLDLKQKDTLSYLKTYLYFIRTNQYGDTVFTKVYHKPRFNIKGADIVKTKWGYLLAGEEYDLKSYHETGLGGYVRMWKIDELGDTISTQRYDLQNADDVSINIIHTIDNGYAVFGQTCNEIQSVKKCNYFLMKLDSNGNKQWHQIYKQSNSSFENPNSVMQLSDGTFYLFGQSTLNSIMKWFLVKTDSMGNKLWQKIYNEYPRQSGIAMIEGERNTILLAGSYSTDVNGNPSGVVRGCTMLIDSSGNKQWSKSYGKADLSGIYTSGLYSVTKTTNKYILAGVTNNYDSLDNGQGWLLAINFNGDSLFQRLYNVNTKLPEHIYSINKTNDGFLMSGYSINPDDTVNTQDAWLLKVDSFGCLTPGCQLVGIDNIPFSREDIKIFPNPAKDKIQISHSANITSFRIADYTGKLILSGNNAELGINISSLASGAYVMQVLLEDGSQAFGKLLVE